ncbi:MAG: sel1 repeat family protein, partial [Alphaproteobacteria bacterium]
MRRAAMGAAVWLLAMLGAAPSHADFAAGARAYDGGDYTTAYTEWLALAETGDAMAQTAIAGMHLFGEGRRVDLPVALGWYRRAARQHHVVAQMNLAEMYR